MNKLLLAFDKIGPDLSDTRYEIKCAIEKSAEGYLEAWVNGHPSGLGIAFHAKPIVRETARQSISTLGLDSLLYLMGIRDRDAELKR